jgi:hypothetical protein
MNLNLTSQEMEVLLSITSQVAHNSEQHEQVWRKVSKEFLRKFDEVRASERLQENYQLTGGK